MSEQTIKLADGTRISVVTGRPIREGGALPGHTVVPTHSKAVAELERVQKRVSDLPLPDKSMHPVALVVAYYLFGLSDRDIAHVCGLTDAQVGNIKMTDAFSSMLETVGESVAHGQQEDVRSMFNQHASTAANKVVTLVTGAEDEKVQLAAARDLLDRAGHRPADVVEHRHKMEGGLVIEYVSKKADSDMPVIELDADEYKETDDGDCS